MTAPARTACSLGRALIIGTRRTNNNNAGLVLAAKFHTTTIVLRRISSTTYTTTIPKSTFTTIKPGQGPQRNGGIARRDGHDVRRASSSSTGSTTTTPQPTSPSLLVKENGTIATLSSTAAASNVGGMLHNVTRHGTGDGVLCLNVGGTEFWTLRSTVSSNSVLAEHVRRAEANLEFSREGAVFIDRDPCQFDIILQHLRNKVEGLSYNAGSVAGIQSKKWLPPLFQKATRPKTYVQLPKENDKLRDLYVEATHYRIPELQAALCEQSLWVTFASAFAGGGNPFDAASTLLIHVRRGLIATGGLGTLFIGADMGKMFDFEWMNNLLGKKEEENDDGDKDSASASIA